MLRQYTTLFIVGAGPTGLAAAISLTRNGVHDFMIVDAASIKDEGSRAIAIHAATPEALDSVDCAEPLIRLGIKVNGLQVLDKNRPIFTTDCSYLQSYTRYPYILSLTQIMTEGVLEAQLRQLVQVLRPDKIKNTDSGDLEVAFESGNTIVTHYVIGADGARSVIRQLAGISFSDPSGPLNDERLSQMVLADVIFSSDSPHLPKQHFFFVATGDSLFLIIPLAKDPDISEPVYRIGFNVPLSAGEPPSNPSMEFLQLFLNEQGPRYITF